MALRIEERCNAHGDGSAGGYELTSPESGVVLVYLKIGDKRYLEEGNCCGSRMTFSIEKVSSC